MTYTFICSSCTKQAKVENGELWPRHKDIMPDGWQCVEDKPFDKFFCEQCKEGYKNEHS